MKKRNKMNTQIEDGFKKVTHCIIDFMIKADGKSDLKTIEVYTGMHSISVGITADILHWMMRDKILKINNSGIVTGSVAHLSMIIEQNKTVLPHKHNKLWSEEDYIQLCELKLTGEHNHIIAKKMNRTEKSVGMQATLVRKAYRLIPIIERNNVIREFASNFVSPNPSESTR